MASLTANAILIALLALMVWKEASESGSLAFRPALYVKDILQIQDYQALCQLPIYEVVDALDNKNQMGKGLQVRDVALGILVSKHDIDIEKILGRSMKSRKLFEEGLLFPSVKGKDFKKIVTYLQTHEAPYTAKGLYKRLPHTANAFFATEVFLQVETLVHRIAPACALKPSVLLLCQEAGWPVLEAYWQKQRAGADYSLPFAQQFLQEALHHGSRQAAYFLVLSSPGHRLDELDDFAVERILSKLDVKTKEVERCCRHIALSARPRSIQELAACRLNGPNLADRPIMLEKKKT